MFGQNPIRPVERTPEMLAVQEIFYTIQGEGPFTGSPAVFIRLAGCNLACTFCDTEFETKIDNLMPVSAIMLEVLRVGTPANSTPPLVVITGGEPMRQDLSHLVPRLVQELGVHVQIETAGTLWQQFLSDWIMSEEVTLVCSPKTPRLSSPLVEVCDHYKYILQAGRVSGEDGLPLGGTQPGNQHIISQVIARPPQRKGVTTWVAPCDAHDERTNALNTQLAVQTAMTYGYRLSLQTHKIVGLP